MGGKEQSSTGQEGGSELAKIERKGKQTNGAEGNKTADLSQSNEEERAHLPPKVTNKPKPTQKKPTMAAQHDVAAATLLQHCSNNRFLPPRPCILLFSPIINSTRSSSPPQVLHHHHHGHLRRFRTFFGYCYDNKKKVPVQRSNQSSRNHAGLSRLC